MNRILPVLCFTLCLISCLFISKSIRKFQSEVGLLPNEMEKGGFQHPAIGVNLPLVFSLPEHVRNRPAIVMLASPACGACRTELQDWLKINETEPVPFMCFYEQDNVSEEKLRSFLQTFEGRVPLQPYPSKLNDQLGIESNPFVCMIDSSGKVHRIQRPLSSLVKYYRQMIDQV